MSYLAGICADFVPQNPGICTGVPSSITLVPSPPPATQTVSTVVTQGSTIVQTITQAVTQTAAGPVTTVTVSYNVPSIGMTSSVVTVPQVAFQTSTPTQAVTVTVSGQPVVQTPSAQVVGLVPANPASVTPASGGSSSTSIVASLSSSSFPSITKNPVGSFTGAAVAHGVDMKLNVAVAGVLGVFAFLA